MSLVNNSSPISSASSSSYSLQPLASSDNKSPTESSVVQVNNANQVQLYVPVLPIELQHLIFRLAFSTMCDVSNHKRGFEPPTENPREMYEEIYEKIKLLECVAPQITDKALSINKIFLEKYLLSQLQLAIKHSLPFINLMHSNQRPRCILYAHKLRKTAHSNHSLEDKLRVFSNFKIKSTNSAPIPCLPFLRPNQAALLIRFTTEQNIKNYAMTYWMRSVTDVAVPIPGWSQDDETKLTILALEAGANPNYEPHGAGLLHECANPLIARRLIKFGADTETPSMRMNGNTPLHSTVKHLGVVRMLCDAKVDLEARNDRNETALISAVSGKHWDSAKLLIRAGAEILVRDDKGKYPLNYTLEYIRSAARTTENAVSIQKAKEVASMILSTFWIAKVGSKLITISVKFERLYRGFQTMQSKMQDN